MKKEIEDYINNCLICPADRPTQARPTCEGSNPIHTYSPMLAVGVDLFNAIGKKWLMMVDRNSVYAWLAELNKTCTSKVTGQLKSWFTEYGWPNFIRTQMAAPNSGRRSKIFANLIIANTNLMAHTTPNPTGWSKQQLRT